MTSDIEELLADGMARYGEAVTECVGLVRGARARLRRRRIVRIGAAAGTALVVGLATVILASGGTRSQPQMITDAYVINRVQDALSAADGNDGLMMYAVVSDPVIKGEIKNWDYHGAGVNELPGTRGPLVTAYSVSGGVITWTSVNYSSRTWNREQAKAGRDGLLPPSFPDRGQYQIFPPCSASGSGVSVFTLNWPGYLRNELACGTFRYKGYTTLGGIRAIELAAENSTAQTGDVSETLWIDPRTYLPVRALSQVKLGTAPPGFLMPGTYTPGITTFQWLPPTPANLGRLKVTIPPGFREVK